MWPWGTEWSREKASNNTREDSTHGRHQMVNTKIRLIVFFAAKDGEALYSQQKQDGEPTVAQITNSLLPNSDWNWRKWRKPLHHSGMTYIKSLIFIQWQWQIDSRFRSEKESAWRTMDRGLWHCTGGGDQNHSQEKEIQKGMIAVWGGLTNSWEKKIHEKRKGKILASECRIPRNSKER